MEMLGNELAKILNLPYEQAIEMLPLLKSQFVLYKLSNIFSTPLIAACIVVLVWMCVCFIELSNSPREDRYEDGDLWKVRYNASKKLFIQSIIAAIAVSLITIFAIAIPYIWASDFMFLKHFIN